MPRPADDAPAEPGERPSLAEAIGRVIRARRSARPRSLPRLRAGWAGEARLAAVLAIVTGLVLALVAHLATGTIASRLPRSRAEAAAAAGARDRLAQVAALFAAPTMAGDLARLARHLPTDIALAGALRREDGVLIVSVRSADPDAVRARLRRDPWLGRFAERGQALSADGRIDIMLAGRSWAAR